MNKKRVLRKKGSWAAYLWVAALSPFIVIFTLVILTAFDVFGRLPSFEELENPKSNIATEIYSDDGVVLGTYFIENRSHLQYEQLFPENVEEHLLIDGVYTPPIVAALIATEDERFKDHGGIDIRSLARVGVKTVMMQNRTQGGGSTISQQLAKNLFPRDTSRNSSSIVRGAKLVTMKLKEWITAIKLEYNYTKDEIAAMYLNTVTYGSNAFGVKAAAETFFAKEPHELKIEEAAVLVGVVNAPTRYSPVRNPKNSLARRNVVISRLEKAGAITKQQKDSISALPIVLNYKPINNNDGIATYFREMIRLTLNAEAPSRKQYYNKWDYEVAKKQYEENPIYGWCKKNKKSDGTPYNIYSDGLKIYTTLDSRMQVHAEEAVQKQLKNTIQPLMDRQAARNGSIFVDAPQETEERIVRNALRYSSRYFNMKDAGVKHDDILKSFNVKSKMKIFTFDGIRDTLLTPRDSVLHYKRIMRASLVAIDPHTGGVKAYVGGPSFRYFKYDMAKQGKRQMGSTIKPLLYTFAIDNLGVTPCTPVANLPVTIETSSVAWSPKESGKVVYDGVMNPLSWGLAKSRNNYSAWIMKQAKQPQAVADFIHNLGVKSYIDPVPALCLGSSESNVFEMASAYSTFVNKGVYTEPIFITRIEDRQGNVIAQFSPRSQDAISEETAYTTIGMLKNVVKQGTAVRLTWAYNMANVEIGGKTGTSQKNRDAWFMAVTPNLVMGSWVGGEEQFTHLTSQGEGSVMALPIVGEFLTRVHKDENLNVKRTDKFVAPLGVEDFDCSKQNKGAAQGGSQGVGGDSGAAGGDAAATEDDDFDFF